jgi:hypothetical protein
MQINFLDSLLLCFIYVIIYISPFHCAYVTFDYNNNQVLSQRVTEHGILPKQNLVVMERGVAVLSYNLFCLLRYVFQIPILLNNIHSIFCFIETKQKSLNWEKMCSFCPTMTLLFLWYQCFQRLTFSFVMVIFKD